MKTINLQTTFKVFLFLFLLCSANAFSFTQIPSGASSRGYESKYGSASKVKKSAKTFAKSTRDIAMQASNKKRFKK